MSEFNNPVVITLDAGGTNLVFGAIKDYKFIVDPITIPSYADNLDRCLESIVTGFNAVIEQLKEKPSAISFAFPGPADYPSGIIGGYLTNFPSFRDGVALSAFLENKFNIPVFINNDANLYAYGETIAGVLPEVNRHLHEMGVSKQYNNLLGFTLGTGLGVGIISDRKLHIGDNSCVEAFCLRNKKHPDMIVEDAVTIRAVKRVYGEISGNINHKFEPKDIFDIAEGNIEGDRQAAIKSFEEVGEIAGDAIATAATLIDGLIVIGGGLMGARKYIMPALLKEMRGKIGTQSGDVINRLPFSVFDLDDPKEFEAFAKVKPRELKVYGSEKTVIYDPMKKIGIITSKIGTSTAISLGAYEFAIRKMKEL